MIEKMGNLIVPVEYIKGIPIPGFLAHVNTIKKLDEVIDSVNGIEKLLANYKAKEDAERFKQESQEQGTITMDYHPCIHAEVCKYAMDECEKIAICRYYK